ncbi:MAG: lipoyl synthase [Syntrophales bacterium]|jgi:lipoic acid synthetase|nr:lipoyl synthase [Syntrophales bacterium]
MTVAAPIVKKPPWLKTRLPQAGEMREISRLLSACRLYTICQEARCPNMAECFQSGTATFLILGDCCTRNCGYCNVRYGNPETVDTGEPERLVSAVGHLGLSYVVMTSVSRDDLSDGGASQFAHCIRRIGEAYPACTVEVLIPDFQGSFSALQTVMEAAPAVINHNMEVCESLFSTLRPAGNYRRSLELLQCVREHTQDIITKSGFMVGLGENKDQIIRLMEELRATGCQRLTIGQYLQPTRNHWPVRKYYHPDEFADFRQIALDMKFESVMAGPLVRSSYHAAGM